MFAVIEVGGHQFKVNENDKFEVNRLDQKEGESFEIKRVLLISNGEDLKIGEPYLIGPKVTAKVVKHLRGEKVITIKWKAKKRHHKKIGHRQDLTEILIETISA